MKSLSIFFLAVWIMWHAISVDAAVDFRAGVNRDTITIGDPIVFRMRIVRDADDVTTFQYADVFPAPFEQMEMRPVQTVAQSDGRVQETHDLVLSIYQVGTFELPPVILKYVSAAGDSGQVQSRAILVVVQSAKGAGETDIRDVKPPRAIDAQVPLWAWLTLLGLILLIGLVIFWVRRRKRRPIVVSPPTDWLAELDKIGRLGLIEQEKYKSYYSLLSDVVRRCLEAKTPVRAVEQTTFEIARDLRKGGLGDGLVAQVEAFLGQADMVKFAKYTPMKSTVEEALPQVKNIVQILVTQKAEVPVTDSEGVSA